MPPECRRFLIAAAASAALHGQTVVEVEDYAKFDRTFESLAGAPLRCETQHLEPEVDFGFRFELRYRVNCDIRQFDGKAGVLKVYLRVRPERGQETVLGDAFAVPAAPKDFDVSKLKRVHAVVGFSGVLAAGIGQYDVDLLVVDHQARVYRAQWSAKAFPKGHERELAFVIPPDTLAPLTPAPIPARMNTESRPLTVLVNAAPLNPWSIKLRAWDRAFLLDSLSTLLRHVSYSSVRVIAFNLEQQQEIFRCEHFGESDVPDLAEALRNLELGTIGYEKLENKTGWADLLVSLLHQEARGGKQPGAVIVLGPNLRLNEKAPLVLAHAPLDLGQSLYCVTYYPWTGPEFPDSIEYLTSAFKGKVFRIHSPAELGQSLAKLEKEMEGDVAARVMRAR